MRGWTANYSKPYEQPIPNFVTVRSVAQTLAQRAVELLLGQPGQGFAVGDADARPVLVEGAPRHGQPGFNLAERDWPHGWKGWAVRVVFSR